MKKTLIALAILATAGTSFAQVTLTGKLGFGAQRQPVNATAYSPKSDSQQGLIMTDGNLTFAATEDLGGGFKAGASMEIRLRGRDDNTPGGGLARDARVSLTTPYGLVTGGSFEAPTALLNAFAGAPVELATNADGNSGNNTSTPLSARANIDAISFTVPVGPVVLTALYGEAGRGTPGLGLAPVEIPQAGNASGITFGTIIARYTAGPIVVSADYTNYAAKNGTVTLETASPAVNAALVANTQKFYDGLDRYRVWGTYDFGMAKVGLGYQSVTHDAADQYSAGVSVPLGAITVGLTYASRDAITKTSTYGLSAKAMARTFTGLGVQYNFSKMTNLNLSYGTFTGGVISSTASLLAGGSGPATENYSDEYRIRLLKNF